jgi:hypothetical protein
MQRESHLLNRFSLRQALGVMTLTAGIAAILRHIRVDNVAAYAFLLAPSLAHCMFRVTGVVLRPCRWCARRPGSALGLISFVTLFVAFIIEIRTSIVFLPISAIWVLQLVIATTIENSDSPQPRQHESWLALRPNGWDVAVVAGLSLLCFLLTICLSIFEANHYITGKGTAFGRYWILVGSGSTTEFQWQDGYSEIPCQWTTGAGRAIPAFPNRDWRFLGLERYRVGDSEKLRVPYWLSFGILLIWPVTWGVGRLRPTQPVSVLCAEKKLSTAGIGK